MNCFEEWLTLISAQEKQQKLQFAILLSYFFDGSILAISSVRKPPEDSVFVSIDIFKYHYNALLEY